MHNPHVPELLDALLEAGANPNLCDKDGSTPLMIAAKMGRKKVVETLIENGADLTIQNKVCVHVWGAVERVCVSRTA